MNAFIQRHASVAVLSILSIPLSASAADNQKPSELQSLLDAGHYKHAKTLVESRLHNNPKDAEALYGAGVIREVAKDTDGAIAAVEQAIAIDPNKALYHAQLGEMYGTKAQSVSMFSAMKFAHKIRDEGEKALQLDPTCSDAYELLIQYYVQAPGIAGGDKNKAYTMLDNLFKFDSVRANMVRGQLALKEKQFDQAENYYANAVRADANSYMAQTALSNVRISRKNYPAGESGAREMLRIDHGRITAYLFLVAIYATQEKWQDLDATLADAEKSVPDDFDAFYQAGRILYTSGKDLPRAEKYFKKYLSQDPEIGAPALAHAHWRLGLVYEKEGRKPEAVHELETAVTMKPDLDDAKKDLKRLK